MGYLVKLDSNGTQPGVLQELFEQGLLDYIAMDIKAPLDRYEEIVRVAVVQEDILKSIRMVMNSGISYEFRTTVVEPLISMEDFKQIGKMIKNASLYILQKYIPSKPLDVSYITSAPPSDQTLAAAKVLLDQDVQTVMIR
jgi:pyruvate formate lyase activating enzyme